MTKTTNINPGDDLVRVAIPLCADRHPAWEQQLLHHLNEGGRFTSGALAVQVQGDDLVFLCPACEEAGRRHKVDAEIKRVDAWWDADPPSR